MLDPAPLVAASSPSATRGTPAPRDRGCVPRDASGAPPPSSPIELAAAHGVDAVALTGGVFQNVRLTEVVEAELAAAGLAVLVHERIPPNDGGISIGQAAIAACRRALIAVRQLSLLPLTSAAEVRRRGAAAHAPARATEPALLEHVGRARPVAGRRAAPRRRRPGSWRGRARGTRSARQCDHSGVGAIDEVGGEHLEHGATEPRSRAAPSRPRCGARRCAGMPAGRPGARCTGRPRRSVASSISSHAQHCSSAALVERELVVVGELVDDAVLAEPAPSSSSSTTTSWMRSR